MNETVKKWYALLKEKGFSSQSFVDGYTPEEIEKFFPLLQKMIDLVGLKAKPLTVWETYDEYGFRGDSEWFLFVNGNTAYSIPTILQEDGDLSSLVSILFKIKQGLIKPEKIEINDNEGNDFYWNAV